jgi:hypothetical protein
MLVGRCSWELSGRKLQRKIKKITNSERSRGICGSADLSWKRGILYANKIVISPAPACRGTGPGFPATQRWTLPRVLLSLRKAA